METAKLLTLARAGWVPSIAHADQPLALVLSGDRTADLAELTAHRSKSALPFAGTYRILDLAISRCIQAGIEAVGVVDLSHARQEYVPQGQAGSSGHFQIEWLASTSAGGGTADAIAQHQQFIHRHQANEVLVVAGDEISGGDFSWMTAQHRETGAALTVAVAAVKAQDARRYDTLIVDEDGRVHKVVPRGSDNPGSLAMIGTLLFSADALFEWVGRVLRGSDAVEARDHDLVLDVIPQMIAGGAPVMALSHRGYWNPLHTARDYWQAHMDLLREPPALDIQDLAGWGYRPPEPLAPTHVAARAVVAHSLISEGCVLEGTVEQSVLSPGVHVAPGAVVRNSIVMRDVSILERAVVENAIVDQGAIIGAQAQVGRIGRHAPTCHSACQDQVTVVAYGVHIPDQTVVGPEPL